MLNSKALASSNRFYDALKHIKSGDCSSKSHTLHLSVKIKIYLMRSFIFFVVACISASSLRFRRFMNHHESCIDQSGHSLNSKIIDLHELLKAEQLRTGKRQNPAKALKSVRRKPQKSRKNKKRFNTNSYSKVFGGKYGLYSKPSVFSYMSL